MVMKMMAKTFSLPRKFPLPSECGEYSVEPVSPVFPWHHGPQVYSHRLVGGFSCAR